MGSSASAFRLPRALTRVAALALIGMLAAAPSVEATVLKGLTVDQLRDGAQQIVEGRVVKVRTVHRDGRIETRARIRVDRTHKGDPSRMIEVRTFGGRQGGKRMVVPGTPEYAKGDRLLLFLYPVEDHWRAVGMFQGVWKLDAKRDIATASRSGGATLVYPDAGVPAVEAGEQSLRQLLGREGI